jgi:chemotaxis signal transduction protein
MVPAFDLASYLGIGLAPGSSRARFALVLARGGDRFGVVVPEMPRVVPGSQLREAAATAADHELASMVEVVFESGAERIHCLNYWSIIDSIMPRDAMPRAGSADEGERRIP